MTPHEPTPKNPRTFPDIEVLPLTPVVELAPEIGGSPKVHVEIEVELLTGWEHLRVQIVVCGLTVELKSARQIVDDANPHFGLGLHQCGCRCQAVNYHDDQEKTPCRMISPCFCHRRWPANIKESVKDLSDPKVIRNWEQEGNDRFETIVMISQIHYHMPTTCFITTLKRLIWIERQMTSKQISKLNELNSTSRFVEETVHGDAASAPWQQSTTMNRPADDSKKAKILKILQH